MAGGRRTKLTAERQKRIFALIRQGITQEIAARRGGINPDTFYAWRKRGEAAKSGIYFEFVKGLEEAQAEAESTLVMQVRLHAKTDWRAGAFILSRRFPERWKKQQTIEVPRPVGTVTVPRIQRMTDEEIAAYEAGDYRDFDDELKEALGL